MATPAQRRRRVSPAAVFCSMVLFFATNTLHVAAQSSVLNTFQEAAHGVCARTELNKLLPQYISAMCSHRGKIYVGGIFNVVDGDMADVDPRTNSSRINFAVWENDAKKAQGAGAPSWRAIGGIGHNRTISNFEFDRNLELGSPLGLINEILALACSDAQPYIYVGGYFLRVRGKVVNNIARYWPDEDRFEAVCAGAHCGEDIFFYESSYRDGGGMWTDAPTAAPTSSDDAGGHNGGGGGSGKHHHHGDNDDDDDNDDAPNPKPAVPAAGKVPGAFLYKDLNTGPAAIHLTRGFTSFGDPATAAVKALACTDDACSGLWVGGRFDACLGVPCSNLVRLQVGHWNPPAAAAQKLVLCDLSAVASVVLGPAAHVKDVAVGCRPGPLRANATSSASADADGGGGAGHSTTTPPGPIIIPAFEKRSLPRNLFPRVLRVGLHGGVDGMVFALAPVQQPESPNTVVIGGVFAHIGNRYAINLAVWHVGQDQIAYGGGSHTQPGGSNNKTVNPGRSTFGCLPTMSGDSFVIPTPAPGPPGSPGNATQSAADARASASRAEAAAARAKAALAAAGVGANGTSTLARDAKAAEDAAAAADAAAIKAAAAAAAGNATAARDFARQAGQAETDAITAANSANGALASAQDGCDLPFLCCHGVGGPVHAVLELGPGRYLVGGDFDNSFVDSGVAHITEVVTHASSPLPPGMSAASLRKLAAIGSSGDASLGFNTLSMNAPVNALACTRRIREESGTVRCAAVVVGGEFDNVTLPVPKGAARRQLLWDAASSDAAPQLPTMAGATATLPAPLHLLRVDVLPADDKAKLSGGNAAGGLWDYSLAVPSAVLLPLVTDDANGGSGDGGADTNVTAACVPRAWPWGANATASVVNASLQCEHSMPNSNGKYLGVVTALLHVENGTDSSSSSSKHSHLNSSLTPAIQNGLVVGGNFSVGVPFARRNPPASSASSSSSLCSAWLSPFRGPGYGDAFVATDMAIMKAGSSVRRAANNVLYLAPPLFRPSSSPSPSPSLSTSTSTSGLGLPPLRRTTPYSAAQRLGAGLAFICADGNICSATRAPGVTLYCSDGIGLYCPCGSTQPDLCPAGHYCPTPAEKYICPEGYFCRQGTEVPHRCLFFQTCPEGTKVPIGTFGGLIMAFIGLLLVWRGARIVEWVRRRGRDARRKKHWEQMKEYSRKSSVDGGGAGSFSSARSPGRRRGSTFGFGSDNPRQRQLSATFTQLIQMSVRAMNDAAGSGRTRHRKKNSTGGSNGESSNGIGGGGGGSINGGVAAGKTKMTKKKKAAGIFGLHLGGKRPDSPMTSKGMRKGLIANDAGIGIGSFSSGSGGGGEIGLVESGLRKQEPRGDVDPPEAAAGGAAPGRGGGRGAERRALVVDVDGVTVALSGGNLPVSTGATEVLLHDFDADAADASSSSSRSSSAGLGRGGRAHQASLSADNMFAAFDGKKDAGKTTDAPRDPSLMMVRSMSRSISLPAHPDAQKKKQQQQQQKQQRAAARRRRRRHKHTRGSGSGGSAGSGSGLGMLGLGGRRKMRIVKKTTRTFGERVGTAPMMPRSGTSLGSGGFMRGGSSGGSSGGGGGSGSGSRALWTNSGDWERSLARARQEARAKQQQQQQQQQLPKVLPPLPAEGSTPAANANAGRADNTAAVGGQAGDKQASKARPTSLPRELPLVLPESEALPLEPEKAADMEEGVGEYDDDEEEEGGMFRVEFTFRNLGVQLSARPHKALLASVTGRVRAGRITAIMGPSGCGKSTFMRAISGRLNRGVARTGRVFVNGYEAKLPRGIVGMVPQDDIMHRDLTVKNCLEYQARLRGNPSMSEGQRQLHVMAIMSVLGLTRVAYSRIGDPEKRGISGGQLKRVNIGMELVADPTVVLLDEPTSGLDSVSSKDLIVCLRKLSRLGITIVLVIHQPSIEIFNLLDDLVLLTVADTQRVRATAAEIEIEAKATAVNAEETSGSGSGRSSRSSTTDTFPRSRAISDDTSEAAGPGQPSDPFFMAGVACYIGPAAKAASFWEARGYGACPVTSNPSDHLLSLMSTHGTAMAGQWLAHSRAEAKKADEEKTVTATMVADVVVEPEAGVAKKAGTDSKRDDGESKAASPATSSTSTSTEKENEPKEPQEPDSGYYEFEDDYVSPRTDPREMERPSMSWCRSLLTFTRRGCLRKLGAIWTLISDLALLITAGFILGALFENSGNGVGSVTDILMRGLLAALTIGLTGAQASLRTFGYDRPVFWREASSGLHTSAFYAGSLIADLPYLVLSPLAFLAMYYPLTAPRGTFLMYYYTLLATEWATTGIGYAVSAAVQPKMALVMTVTVVLVCILFGGLIPSVKDMKKTTVGRIGLELSYARWTVEALVVGEMSTFPPIFANTVFNIVDKRGYAMDELRTCYVYLASIGAVMRVFAYSALKWSAWRHPM